MSPEPRDTSLPTPPPLAVPADLDARLAAIGVTLTPEAIAKIAQFLATMLAVNERMNLTAVIEPEAVWTRHALDGCTMLPGLAPVPAGARLLDLGSGGGVPGILVAIARPDLRVTLVEATQKKAAFLTAVAAALGLTNVVVVAERAEKLGKEHHSQDVVMARAVAKLVELVPWAGPLVRPDGLLLFIKGERAGDELHEARYMLKKYSCRHIRTVQTPTGRVVVLRRNQ